MPIVDAKDFLGDNYAATAATTKERSSEETKHLHLHYVLMRSNIMKYYKCICLLITTCLLGPALAGGKPEVNLALNLKSLDSMKGEFLDSFVPGAKWSQDGTFATCSYNVGVEVKDFADKDGAVPNYNLFGTLKKSIPGWTLSAGASADSTKNFDTVSASLSAAGGPAGSTLKVAGKLDTDTGAAEITGVSLDQPISVLGGTLGMFPNYNLAKSQAGLVLTYERDNTAVTVGGTSEAQSLTIAQTFGGTMIAPTLTYEGDLSVAFSRKIGDGKLSGSYVPDSALSLKYAEDPFTVNLNVPVDGFYKPAGGTKLALKMALPEQNFNIAKLETPATE